MDFLERAQQTIALGVPVIRLQPRTKAAMDKDWPSLATTDLNVIKKWNEETPDANVAAVAKAVPGGVFFFEVDDASLPTRIEEETGQKLPRTFRVRSSPGKGHFYFKATPESIQLSNVSQGYVKGGNFSVRADRAYVVAANSLHPSTGLPYQVVSDCEIAECPTWLLNWIKNQKLDKKKSEDVPRDANNLIPHGYIHDQLVVTAGKLVAAGLSMSAVEDALLSWAHDHCAPPLDDNHIRQVARSTGHWKKGNPLENAVYVGGKLAGIPESVLIESSPQDLEDAVPIDPLAYPVFPDWVMRGTSIYEGLVKPFCDSNSRYAPFMFLPSLVLLLNYLGGKCRIEQKNFMPSIFMVSIGRRGKILKSTSIEDSIKYFEYAGLVGHHDVKSNNADGRSMVFTPASPEGLGKEMLRTNCRNSILFYDELSMLVNKAGIESSNLSSTLLTLYESGSYQNLTKVSKDSFSFAPGTYTTSLLACSTDKNFIANWGKLAGKSSGLDDRFIFLMQPEVLKPLTPYIHVNTQDGAIKTRQLVDKAVQQGVFRIVDSSPLSKFTQENDDSNRAEIRAEKLALALAVDMGCEEIEEEQIERGLAIVAYEQQVKKYLRTFEAQTREGSIQMETMYNLRKAGGSMTTRELQRVMNSTRYGTSLWSQSYIGLIKSGWIKEIGTGTKGDPKIVVLLRVPEEDD